MKKEKRKERLPKEIRPENLVGLKEIYKQVCVCTKCGIKYGTDLKKEEEPFLCPMCSLTSNKRK